MVPEDGGKTPATMLNSVVLPAPLGPISPVIEPFSIDSETPSTARMPPKFLATFSTVIIQSILVAGKQGTARDRDPWTVPETVGRRPAMPSVVHHRFELAALDFRLAEAARGLARLDQLQRGAADIVDLAAVSQDLQALCELAGIDLLARSVGDVKHLVLVDRTVGRIGRLHGEQHDRRGVV